MNSGRAPCSDSVKVAARHTFIINPEVKVVKVYTEVNPNQHRAEMLAALTELQN